MRYMIKVSSLSYSAFIVEYADRFGHVMLLDYEDGLRDRASPLNRTGLPKKDKPVA